MTMCAISLVDDEVNISLVGDQVTPDDLALRSHSASRIVADRTMTMLRLLPDLFPA